MSGDRQTFQVFVEFRAPGTPWGQVQTARGGWVRDRAASPKLHTQYLQQQVGRELAASQPFSNSQTTLVPLENSMWATGRVQVLALPLTCLQETSLGLSGLIIKMDMTIAGLFTFRFVGGIFRI